MGLGHWFKKGSVWGGLMVLVMNTTTVWAHPHSWIDTTTTIEGDGQAITGFHMAWTFDPMTTAYMLDGEDMSTQQRENTLHKVALSVINNMLSSHYFTYFFEPDGKTPIRYQQVDTATLTMDKGKATLRFDLPLVKPYPLNGNSLTLKIFDPTYYVDMSWSDEHPLKLSDELQPYCHSQVIEPNPTPKQVSYAMSIPADADPDDALGQLFTQSATITCHTK